MTRHFPRRLKVAWRALRGRPIAYRLHIAHGVEIEPMATGCVIECLIHSQNDDDPGVRFVARPYPWLARR